jgi:hypothetical protein
MSDQERLDLLIKQLRELDIKLTIYAERDWLAYGVHYENYKTLDLECLDLMTKLNEQK